MRCESSAGILWERRPHSNVTQGRAGFLFYLWTLFPDGASGTTAEIEDYEGSNPKDKGDIPRMSKQERWRASKSLMMSLGCQNHWSCTSLICWDTLSWRSLLLSVKGNLMVKVTVLQFLSPHGDIRVGYVTRMLNLIWGDGRYLVLATRVSQKPWP